jgi:uncharacterized membrane protein HdeD (DUF308 family)
MLHIPSFYALIINGLLILVLGVLLIRNFFIIKYQKPFNQMVLLSLIAMTIALHGILHLGLEKQYGYNPLKYFY